VRRIGHAVEYRSLAEPNWVDALTGAFDLVAVAGGDGSVAQVLLAMTGATTPVTLLPLGTANNVASSLGLTADPETLVGGWSRGRHCRYDVGTVAGPGGEARFVEAVGGGLVADAIVRAEAECDGSDKLDDGLRVLAELLVEREPQPWQVEIDGSDLSTELLAVEAMLVGRAGPGVPFAPPTDHDDGLLDVVLVGEAERPAVAKYVEERRRGGRPRPPRLPVRQGRHVRIVPPPAANLRVDDEPWEHGAPVVVATGELAVEILLPAGAVPRASRLTRIARPRHARRLRARASFPSPLLR